MNSQTKKKAALTEAIAWFVKLDASEVSDKTKAAFFTWLDNDSINQNAYIETEKLWGKLEIVSSLPVEATPQKADWFGRIFGPAGAFVTATVIMAIFAIVSLSPPAPTLIEYTTAVGERVDFRLEDGSLLQLNTNSAVSVQMEKNHRLLTLQRGEAFFDIAPNAKRPLVVQTSGGLVRVLGTRFNIRQTQSGSVVSVIEGLVAVAADGEASAMAGPDFKPELTLEANQQAELITHQAIAPPIKIKADTVLAWRQGKLIYEGNTLAEVVSDLNRYFPGTISLAEPALGELEIVGVLNLHNRTATLSALEATFGVQVVEISDQLTLIRPGTSQPGH